tara:strand:+ start:3184 stop:3330 length:147 start_codon:yes stop_codon:yes gene_type:complete
MILALHFSTFITSARTDINNPIAIYDNLHIVLNHNNRIASVNKNLTIT